jgi:hypothetical protein
MTFCPAEDYLPLPRAMMVPFRPAMIFHLHFRELPTCFVTSGLLAFRQRCPKLPATPFVTSAPFSRRTLRRCDDRSVSYASGLGSAPASLPRLVVVGAVLPVGDDRSVQIALRVRWSG